MCQCSLCRCRYHLWAGASCSSRPTARLANLMPSCHAPRRPHLRGALYLLRGGGGGTVQKKTLERLSDEGLSRRPEVRAGHVASALDVLASISCLLVPVSAVLVLVLGVPMPVLVQLLVLVCWCLSS